MSNGEEIRVLRYHMTSGHVLAEHVDEELSNTTDQELLDHLAQVFAKQQFIVIKESTTDSAVMVSTNRIEFVQVAYASLLISREEMEAATASEETAIEVARRLWGLGHDDAS